jgi:hypothetical protein
MDANSISVFGFGVELTASFLGLLPEHSANAKDRGSSLALPTACAGLMSLFLFSSAGETHFCTDAGAIYPTKISTRLMPQ